MSFSRDKALDYLRRAYDQNRLAHAYLISGPAGSGKRQLAAELAGFVNKTDANEIFSANSREVFTAEPESKSRRIVIEQVRELEHTLQMRAIGGRLKVAIIFEADRLQPQAANAFLKTLEEPPKDSLLLLLSALPEALPDTIVSRCIAISLSPNGAAQSDPDKMKFVDLLRESAKERSWSVQSAYRLAQEFQLLLRSIREEIKANTDEALKMEEARYRNSTDGVWLEEREQYYKALSESRYLQRRADLIEVLLCWWTDVLRAATDLDRRDFPEARKETGIIAKQLSSTEILRRIGYVEELRDHLGPQYSGSARHRSGVLKDLRRNIDFQPVCPAETLSAVSASAGFKPAGRTGHSPMFRSSVPLDPKTGSWPCGRPIGWRPAGARPLTESETDIRDRTNWPIATCGPRSTRRRTQPPPRQEQSRVSISAESVSDAVLQILRMGFPVEPPASESAWS